MDLIKDLDTNLVAGWVIAVVVTVLCGLFGCLHYYNRRSKRPVALSSEFQSWPLIQKDILSHDTRRFTFALPSPQHRLGLPIGQHMTLGFTDPADGVFHQRSYTPVTDEDTLGQVSFIIKVYRANVHPKFPHGGKVSQHLDSLQIGDTIQIKGPKGNLHWLGKGKFTIRMIKKPLQHRSCTHLGMMAGGTGITPMLQVLHAIFKNPQDKTLVKLLYANQCTYNERKNRN
jgi:cytochrome-b5 reductase